MIWKSIVSSVLSGLLLAFIFFWTREKWVPLPDIAGHWTVEMHTITSDYDNYRGIKVEYEAILWQDGTVVRGTIEKTRETSRSDSTKTYIGEERARGNVEGAIQKLYFSKDRVNIHIMEEGELRDFTHFHDLTVFKTDSIAGSFFSTAADSEGKSTWIRSITDEPISPH